jgi:hypothetical protein
VAAQQGWLALSAKNWAFQVLFPSFVPALAIFVTVLIGVAMMRRNSTPPTADPLSRILIAGPFVVALWLGGFYVLRSMIETKAYWRLSLVGAFVVALLVEFFWPEESRTKWLCRSTVA